jgi:hypothetical protein
MTSLWDVNSMEGVGLWAVLALINVLRHWVSDCSEIYSFLLSNYTLLFLNIYASILLFPPLSYPPIPFVPISLTQKIHSSFLLTSFPPFTLIQKPLMVLYVLMSSILPVGLLIFLILEHSRLTSQLSLHPCLQLCCGFFLSPCLHLCGYLDLGWSYLSPPLIQSLLPHKNFLTFLASLVSLIKFSKHLASMTLNLIQSLSG